MKIVQTMKIGDHVRQGDLLIIKTGEANSKNQYKPQDLIPDGILALGETTGHAHRVAATLEEIFSPQDIEFLRQEQERLGDVNVPPILEIKVLEGFPVVLKRNTSFIGRFTNSIKAKGDVIAIIHSPAPFWVAHYNKKTAGVMPVDSRKIIETDKLHEPIQLPPGFYKVVQQREAAYTDAGNIKIQRVID